MILETRGGTCTNTRDNTKDYAKCSDQLKEGKSSCNQYIRWKDCDAECNLCACSTAAYTNKEHCSGHGTCDARCDQSSCQDAKCVCNKGWKGDRCQIKRTRTNARDNTDGYAKCSDQLKGGK